MKFISFLLLTSLTFEAFAQSIKDPGTGQQQGGVTDLLTPPPPTTSQSGPLPTPTAFPGCPFTLDIDELVPPDVENEFKNLQARLTASQDPGCRAEGESIGNLLSLLGVGGSGRGSGQQTGQTPPPPTDPGAGDIDLGSLTGKGGTQSPPPVTQQPPISSSPGENCRNNPARCEALITQILENARTKTSCYGGNAVDTVLGMAFRIGSPVVGQIALGVSVVRSIIGLFRGRRTDARADMNQFFTQEVPKRQMDTLQACYGNQLYQDVNCRQPYLDCLTNTGETVARDGFCAFGTNMGNLSQAGSDPATRGAACTAYRQANPLNERVSFQGRDIAKIDLLELCLKDSDATAQMSGDAFLIDTKEMADMYACLSYWTNVQRSKGVAITEAVMRPLRQGCMAGKKTKGGAPINQYVFEYNKLRMRGQAENTNFVRTNLLPDVLGIAQRFHRDQIDRATYQDESGIQGAVNTCFYGYGVDMAMGGQRDGSYRQERRSLPDKCENLNTCTERVVSQFRTQVQVPRAGQSFYSAVIPVQNLNQMYLNEQASNPSRNRFASDMGRLCYGMAMNQIVDHSGVTAKLRDIGFNGTTCERTGSGPSLLGSDDAPSSGQ